MTTSHTIECPPARSDGVFDDPVSYLAALGIESELIEETTLWAAA